MDNDIMDTFTLFQFDDTDGPANQMIMLVPGGAASRSAQGSAVAFNGDDLARALTQPFNANPNSRDGAETTLQDLGITDFDEVFVQSMISRHQDADPEAIREGLKALSDAGRALTKLGLRIVVGFKTTEEEDVPPITIRAGR